MLRLLLSLASIASISAAGTVLSVESQTDISACPVQWFGKTYTSFFYNYLYGGNTVISFDKLEEPNDYANDSVFYKTESDDPTFSIITDLSEIDAEIKTAENTTEIQKVTPTCALSFERSTGKIYLVPYGTATLFIKKGFATPGSVYIYVSENKVVDGGTDDYYWVAGCPMEGEKLPLMLFSTNKYSEKCETERCEVSGRETTSDCAPNEICKYSECKEYKKLTCAMVPGAVIDSAGKARFLEDFCTQLFLSNRFLSVSGFYSNRRFTDIPFLESIIFSVDNENDYILSGNMIHKAHSNGMVPVTVPDNGSITDELVFAKVPGGVLVNITKPDFSAELFFDGTTAQIHYEGLGEDLIGVDMCTNNSVPNVNQEPSGCTTVDSDPRGDGIDCDAATQKCNKLLEEPFSSCSVDPEPFIAACTNLLCNYTDTDGLFCHLLEAYASSCRLQDWMDSVGCSHSGCSDQHCLFQNEFCGLSIGGAPGCFCRASYSAPYRTKGTLGEDTVCASKMASVSLVGCLLEEKGINISSLHLKDPSCTGAQDPTTKMITFSFSDTEHCGANVSVDGNKIIYSNTIMIAEETGIISREDQVYIQFSCTYVQPQVQTMSLKIMDSSVVKVIDAGEWTYVFNMTAFTDQDLTSAVDSQTELRLDEPLWIQAKASDVDDQLLALVIEDCWATKEKTPNAADKYSLMKNGCSDEESVKVLSNGENLASVFSFRAFQFVGNEADIYLHCDTKLCVKSTGCTKTCGGE